MRPVMNASKRLVIHIGANIAGIKIEICADLKTI
jgi:hypothetical protein